MDQRVGSGIDLLFHDPGIRRNEWSAARPGLNSPAEKKLPILLEATFAPGPDWMGEKFRPYRDSIPDVPYRSQSLYQLSYLAHNRNEYLQYLWRDKNCRYLGLTNLLSSRADILET